MIQQLFDFPFRVERSSRSAEEWLSVGARRVRLRFVRHRRARRYVLRFCPNGEARVTIPRRGSAAEAKRFAERNRPWLEKQFLRQAAQSHAPRAWPIATEILFRGERVRLEMGLDGRIRCGNATFSVTEATGDLRPAIERHLWKLARWELTARSLELAALHEYSVQRVLVRNQRSRWGSCSRLGSISLNWRLVQAPPFVRDYIILHELAHLKEMNHSRRFWREVARLCPNFAEAERWLKQHASLLA